MEVYSGASRRSVPMMGKLKKLPRFFRMKTLIQKLKQIDHYLYLGDKDMAHYLILKLVEELSKNPLTSL